MIVMPFNAFKEQGRICKSMEAWRRTAREKKALVEFARVEYGTGKVNRDGTLDGTLVIAEGKVAIYISHAWWHRDFQDDDQVAEALRCEQLGLEPDKYDKGAPDYQSGEKRNKKWSIICLGVECLIREKHLLAEDIMLWVDWLSIYQDDEEVKELGVRSLICYASLCEYMLIPTEQEDLDPCTNPDSGDWIPNSGESPQYIPGYGSRSWCRCESFIFQCLAEMRGRLVQLYGIKEPFTTYTGKSRLSFAPEQVRPLHQYKVVKPDSTWKYQRKYEPRTEQLEIAMEIACLPSSGELSVESDHARVQSLENTMMRAYCDVQVVNACRNACIGNAPGKIVDLSYRRAITPEHIGTLAGALRDHGVITLTLTHNPGLRDARVGELLEKNSALQVLDLSSSHLGAEAGHSLASALTSNTVLTSLNLSENNLGLHGGGGAALATALASPGVALTYLNLGKNGLGDEAGKAIASALKLNAKLSTLDLNHNQIGDEGGKALADALRDNRGVRIINLVSTFTDGHAYAAVRDAVAFRASAGLKLEASV